METTTYLNNKRTYYYAEFPIVTLFTDMTERSPTFSLSPVDQITDTEPKSWAQMFTKADSSKEAWVKFLGRSYKGLRKDIYYPHFEVLTHLRQKALDSLEQAGPNQEALYDFSFSKEN